MATELNEDGHVVCPCGHGSNWHCVLGCDWCECPNDMDAAIEAAGVTA